MSRTASPQRDPKSGTWWFVTDVAPGADGQRRQAKRRGYRTKAEAAAALDKLRVSNRDGSFIEPAKTTVAEYLATWVDSLVVTGKRPSTVASYGRNLRLHVLPRIGSTRLQLLNPLQLDGLYSDLLTAGNRRGRATGTALSPRTVRYIHTIVRKALADALAKGLVVRNVAEAASPPSAKSTKAREMQWWTPADMRTFLDSVVGDELGPLFRLACMTGMRRGEVLGLRWADLHLDDEQPHLEVRQQVVDLDPRQPLPPCPVCGAGHTRRALVPYAKSDSGQRRIDLDARTVAALRSHRARQNLQRLAIGAGWVDHDLLFTGLSGAPLDPPEVARRFTRRVRAAGLPVIRFHDLRHSHAAHLIAAGEQPLLVSRRLGHASTSFTQDRYGHLFPEAGTQAASAVAAMVDGPLVTNL